MHGHCPHCGLPELVHKAWDAVCLACGKSTGVNPGEPPEVKDDLARSTSVTTPVRPGHSLISGAAATEVLPPQDGSPAPVVVEKVETEAEPPTPPSEPPAPVEAAHE